MASINRRIAEELGVREGQVTAAVDLLDGGATVPFIARYRKEATGTLDDAQLRTLEERLRYLRELEERRAAILASVQEQGKLTDELRAQILSAETKSRLEDIYLPYKPKRRTKAQIAREAGLEPLAVALLGDPSLDPTTAAGPYVDADKGMADTAAALDGARSILVERMGEDADLIGTLRERLWKRGRMLSAVRDGAQDKGAKFSDYFEFAEALSSLPSHRVLALFRGEKEDVLDLTIEPEEGIEAGVPTSYEATIAHQFDIANQGRPGDRWLADTVRWAWRTKILVHLGIDVRLRLRSEAEDEAVRVFAANLRDLLLAAPAGTRATMGLDPGLRTGVKVAVVDATGKVVEYATIYPHQPANRWDESLAMLATLARKHDVDLVAIGNGTASRETERLAADLMKKAPELGLTKAIVSEAGASVYSASAYASAELPDLDVSIRGAVSIARRLQDPLAELVKIDPKSIGVGQYQHDITETKLSRSLDAVVEDCVNGVGVDLNTASVPLLSRVSGITSTLAENIVSHRDANGPYSSRAALKNVPRLGPKAFEQCAGFLKVSGGDEPLDASSVHPEAYPLARRIVTASGADVQALIGNGGALRTLQADRVRGRDLRSAHGHRHLRRAGEARPRPAARVHHGVLRGRRREARRPGARHGAGGPGHERRGVRRVRGHRCAPGRARARLGDVQELRQRPARGREVGRHRQGQGHGRRPAAQADLPDVAPGRRDRCGPRRPHLGRLPLRRSRARAGRAPADRAGGQRRPRAAGWRRGPWPKRTRAGRPGQGGQGGRGRQHRRHRDGGRAAQGRAGLSPRRCRRRTGRPGDLTV